MNPSIVLFGLTLGMKGLFPKFFPAKKAIESINILMKIIYKISNLSFSKLKDKLERESILII
jgi:hypothetical protein